MLERIARSGIGGVITKSIGLEPRDGYTNPTVIGLGRDRVLNAIGLSNPGAKYAQNELKNYTVTDVPLIASVFGASGDEIANVIQIIDQPIISAFELNLSCPHGGLYGAAIGTDCAVVEDVVNTAKSVTSKPIWAKLTPNVTDIVNIAKGAVKGGADALVAINTLQAMAIDIYLRKPILSNVFGGLSGPAIKPVAIKCVYELYKDGKIDVPILGVGGARTGSDIAEFLMAGATAVQIGSAVLKETPEQLFPRLALEIRKFMIDEGFSTIKEMIGLAHHQ